MLPIVTPNASASNQTTDLVPVCLGAWIAIGIPSSAYRIIYQKCSVFGKWGLPAFTGPFVITAWFFMFAVEGFMAIPAGVGWARP